VGSLPGLPQLNLCHGSSKDQVLCKCRIRVIPIQTSLLCDKLDKGPGGKDGHDTHRANESDAVSVMCQPGASSTGKGFKSGIDFWEGRLTKVEAKKGRLEYEEGL